LRIQKKKKKRKRKKGGDQRQKPARIERSGFRDSGCGLGVQNERSGMGQKKPKSTGGIDADLATHLNLKIRTLQSLGSRMPKV
jgi:hypothetical protein